MFLSAVGCSGGGTPIVGGPTPIPTPTPAPSPQPSPTPQPSAHLYAISTDQNGVPEILLFALPLTSSSVPSFTATGAAGNLIAVDANGDIAVMDSQCHLTIYNAPITNPLTPSATFNNPNCAVANISAFAGLAFSPSGDLFVVTGTSQINIFTHPFSSASTVSQTFNVPQLVPSDLGLDPSGNLYVASTGLLPVQVCGFIGNILYVFAPPYTGGPVFSTLPFCGDFDFVSVAVSSTLMFVSTDHGGVIDFTLPLPTGTQSGIAFTSNTEGPAPIALDPSGNLYVNEVDDGQIQVYMAPISLSSTPSVTLSVKAGSLAVGP